MKKQPFLSGIAALVIALSLIGFRVFEHSPRITGKHSASAQYYWYYVASDGYVYSYSLAWGTRKTLDYALSNGACRGNVYECMRGFVYPLAGFPDNSPGDETIYKATP